MRLALLLLPVVLFGAPPRYARLGEFQGTVEVQLTAAHPWMPAERNLPLMESTWVRTGAGSRLEVELDEGNALRLGPNSQVELADYKRLSTGQRITLLTLDRGIAYFTGIAEGNDALLLSVLGAQLTVSRGTRVRLEVQEQWSQIAVIEGVVRFSSPAAELDLREGQTTRIDPANPARFFLNKEVAVLELDRWSEDRDKLLATSTSATHVLMRYGLSDLDAAGEWIQTEDLGSVWRPKTEEGWRPFQNGRWRWYDTLGYTWVSDESWGWLPYHHGRWQRKENLGWVWAPSQSIVFKPGDVYWLRGAKLAGWGPLGPGEQWPAPENAQPRQYLVANTVWSSFATDAAVLDPVGFAAPKEPLAVASFAVALPSPMFAASKLDANRPWVRAARGRVTPLVDGVTFSGGVAPQPQQPVVVITEAPAPPPPGPSLPDGIYGPPPVVAISQPNILIVNVPGNPDYSPRPRQQPGQNTSQSKPPAAPSTTPPATTPPSTPAASAPAPGRTIAGLPKLPLPEVGPPRRDPPTVARTEEPAAPTRTAPDVDTSKSRGDRTPPVVREKKFRDAGESQLLNEVIKNVATPNYNQALASLDLWTRRYRNSEFSDDRSYYYMQTYTGLNQPSKVMEAGAQLVIKGAAALPDPMQTVGVLYLASFNMLKVEHPTRAQLELGRQAAAFLLESLPRYFTPQNRPPAVTAEAWIKAQKDMESIAQQTLARAKRAR